MQQLAAQRGVPLHLHAVIYQLIDALKDELSARLPPLTSESVLGESSTRTLAPQRHAPSCDLWLLPMAPPPCLPVAFR